MSTTVRQALGARPHPFLHESRRQDDREADDEKNDRERLHPLGQSDALGKNLDDLQGDPAGTEIDPQHLPKRAAVDLVDELLRP